MHLKAGSDQEQEEPEKSTEEESADEEMEDDVDEHSERRKRDPDYGDRNIEADEVSETQMPKHRWASRDSRRRNWRGCRRAHRILWKWSVSRGTRWMTVK